MSETLSSNPVAFASVDTLLAAIVDSTDDAIVSKNLDGIITSWNRGAERIFGFTAQEIVGQPIFTIIPLDRQSEEVDILIKLKHGDRVDHFDTQRMRKDGSLVEVSLTISPVRNAEGVVIGASKIARDITLRKEAEATLDKQRFQLETLNQLSSTMAAELDVEKLVQAVTDAGRKLSGAAFGAFFYNATTDEGETLTLFTLSGAPRSAFEKFGAPKNTPLFGPTFRGECVVRFDDVTKSPIYEKMEPYNGMPMGHLPLRSYLAVPVISRSGDVIGGLFFGHPEPARFTAESEDLLVAIAAQSAVAIDNARLYHALKESEALSSSVLTSSADAVAILDPDGRLQSMNPAGQDLFQISNFEAERNQPWAELWPESVRTNVTAAITAAANGQPSRFQEPCRLQGSMEIWCDVLISPILETSGRVIRLTSIARDITDQRRAAEEVRAAGLEAERQSRMKDEFLATLSHELRTPLQSILGWVQLLRRGEVEPDELMQAYEVIDRNAKSQTRIIEDLLDMSRILSGKVRLDVQRVELGPVIEAALESVKPAAEAREIRLQSVIDPLAREVAGDPNRLQQVFWNLLSNAIKFTPRGGRVQVLLERVNSHLEVSVTDTGPGISPEFLPHVFERFRQADSSSTRQHGGLGLGLAIVKHLAELHGGTVRAKSNGVSQGATFIVMLPLAPLRSTPEESRHPSASTKETTLEFPNLEGISVLVVDDEFDARQLLTRMLVKVGASVDTAGSVDEALRKLKSRVPNVMISDIGMPVQDGYALIRSVRELPASEGGKVPAIALTAYTRTEDRIKAITEGFQMHLSKPADALELLTMVASLAGKKS